MNITPKTRIQTRVVLATLLVAGALAFAPTVSAHNANHGTIKVHDEAIPDNENANVPHVSCDFWIQGFNMDGSGGELIFYGWPPTGNTSEVIPTGDPTWTGVLDDDDDGYNFLNGPFQLPPGHYRVEAFSDEGHPGNHGHFSKSKTFWVDPCGQDNPCESLSLLLTTNDGGSITVDVTHATGADGTSIYRSAGGGDYELVATLLAPDDQYVDDDTVIGETYAYAGTALKGQAESTFCDGGEVTSVPVFPSALAASLAILVSALGYVFARRRS